MAPLYGVNGIRPVKEEIIYYPFFQRKPRTTNNNEANDTDTDDIDDNSSPRRAKSRTRSDLIDSSISTVSSDYAIQPPAHIALMLVGGPTASRDLRELFDNDEVISMPVRVPLPPRGFHLLDRESGILAGLKARTNSPRSTYHGRPILTTTGTDEEEEASSEEDESPDDIDDDDGGDGDVEEEEEEQDDGSKKSRLQGNGPNIGRNRGQGRGGGVSRQVGGIRAAEAGANDESGETEEYE